MCTASCMHIISHMHIVSHMHSGANSYSMQKNKMKMKAKGRGTPKASLTKLANKNKSKLGRQGKLNKNRDRKIPNGVRAKRTVEVNEQEVEEETEDVLDEEDVDYYTNTESDISFLASAQLETTDRKSRRDRKRKLITDDSTIYENVPRKRFSEEERRHLLPIKTGNKVIPQSVEHEDKPSDAEAGSEEEEEKEEEEQEKELPALSTVSLYASRQKKLAEKKMRIANAATSILEDPQENVSRLRELRLLLEETDPEVYITVRKYAMLSLLEVFTDILPDYRVRLATDKERDQAQKKETKALREFEEGLLHHYKLYLQYLETVLKGNKSSRGKIAGAYIPERVQRTFRELAVQCMCSLLTSHPDFNFRSNLVTTLVPFIVHINQQISDKICTCVRTLFKGDREGHISLEIVLQISKLLKAREHNVHPKVVQTFSSLKIKEVDFDREKTENKTKRKENILKMSRKERKRAKKMKMLNKEMEEAAATVDKNKKLQNHTRIVEQVFMIYFRVLKSVRQSGLLSAVLEGLAKFAHLINIDFFNDLFNVLNELVDSEDLSVRDRLHCIKASFTILTGQGSALTIDPLNMYTRLYALIYTLTQPEDVRLLLECLEMMLIKRRKQVTKDRALAYMKRLSTHCLNVTSAEAALALMAAVRRLLQAYAVSEVLYDTEGSGSGVYLPELSQPEHCHAHNAQLWEYHLIKRHSHPDVRVYGDHMSRGAPCSGQQQLPAALRKEPLELFVDAAPTEKKLFNPPILPPRKTKGKAQQTSLRDAHLSDHEMKLNQWTFSEEDLKLLTNYLLKKR